VVEGGWRDQLVGIRKSGERFCAHVALSPLGTPGHVGGGCLVVTCAGPAEGRPLAQKADPLFATAENADAVAIVDRDGVIADVNHSMIELTGRALDDLIGTPVTALFGDIDMVESSIRQAFAGEPASEFELTLQHPDGRHVAVRCRASTLHSDAPAPGRVQVAVRDATTQQRVDWVQAQLSALMQSSHDAIVGKTLDGVITSWNPGAERLYGYAAPEVIGRRFEVIIPVEARADEADRLARVASGERVEVYEADRIQKSGSAVTVSVAVSPITDADGRIVGVASMSRDLSERKAAEAKVRWMLEVAPDAILGLDASGTIELVNAQCERLFGYDRAELMGQPVEILIPDGVRPVDAGQIGAGMELAALHKNGTKIPVEISLSALETPGGRLTMAAVRDITDRRDVERQLYQKNVELERASRAKDNFLASMSHELRTPLNAIIGFTGTMLMRLPGPLNTDQEHQLGLVQASGKHLLSIINDLLDLAKIESGQVQIALERIDCRSVAQGVVQGLEPLAKSKGIVLLLQAPDTPMVATADRRALGQILINLVNNAVKFTDRGEVDVSLTYPDNGHGPLRIAVTDTGPGIPHADLARIFRAFERSATTAKPTDEGTGLGLHISHKLAELLHATLTVTSVVGQGSTFVLTLADR
jgi:protein-histidine pros-kinase